MPRNVEVKARVADLVAVEARARAIAEQGPFEIEQRDTFFACPHGRLKLRELTPIQGELIFYDRPDVAGPKLSQYVVVPTSSPHTLRDTLGRALGVVGQVHKRRRLYLVQNTRIHLDEVDGLGSFVELEVVLSDSQSTAEGEIVSRRLLSILGVAESSLVSGAYVDLLAADGSRRSGDG